MYVSVHEVSLNVCVMCLVSPAVSTATGKYFQMSSFGESSAVKYSSRNQCSGFMLYNKKQLSRIYPSGRRVDSSNYNPVDMWNSGCQIGESSVFWSTYSFCMFVYIP